ncbi:MAG: hypothetical protein OEV42_07625 [Deltaproteobacteria bacterium]|nr:hypothetical protein [Deltaproteobacteria bacterium]
MRKILALIILIFPVAVWAESKDAIDIRDEMTMREFTGAGLDKLSPGEIEALNKWLGAFVSGTSAKGDEGEEEAREEAGEEPKKNKKSFWGSLFSGAKYKIYKIEKVESDHHFRINKNPYTSTSVCPGYATGDEVIFTEGRADGMCDNAEFSRPDGRDSCEVFCR